MTPERPSAFSLWLNLAPFAHLAIGALLAARCETAAGLALFALAWIYLVPPLAGRALLTLFGRPAGELTQDMRAYRVWWALTQLQMIFNRIPWLEEALRLAPGLYPLWIGLWGGRLSPFALVSPGVVITDRYLVEVERDAVLGMQAALAGHMVTRDEAGRWRILVAAPRVEAEAIMGGASGLGPGAVLAAGALLPTGRRVGPLDRWPREKAPRP